MSTMICSADRRRISSAVCGFVASGLVLLSAHAAAGADENRWRLSKSGDGTAMLAVTDTDEATDAIGSLYLHCKPGTGSVTVDESNMRDKRVRAAIANLILNDGYPTVELEPAPERSAIEAITNSDDGGWGYRFEIGADAVAFNQFKKTGYLKFKIGTATIQAGVKVGFDKIAEFQAICRRPPK